MCGGLRGGFGIALVIASTAVGQVPQRGQRDAGRPKRRVESQRGGVKTVVGVQTRGLAFRLIWFEAADMQQPGAVTRFVFPAGADYPSQRIRASKALYPGAQMSTDADGNISMIYRQAIPVEPGRPLLMGFAADVTYFGRTHLEIDPQGVDRFDRLPADVRRAFLIDGDEYDIGHPAVRAAAARLRIGAPDPVTLMRRIWEYVNGLMKYDLPPRPNTGAEVLGFKRGLCGEYTRLTVTLSRACGLPARQTQAFGMFTTGPADNDHAWADVYLSGAGWTPVQPQEPLPEKHEYPLNYYRYLVVYRGDSFLDQQRVIETENVAQHRPSGCGFFARTPAEGGQRRKAIVLMQKICASDGREDGRLLRRADRAHASVQPVLYWALAGSRDAAVGLQAAERLMHLCKQGDRKLKAEMFVKMSPTLVRHRIDIALGRDGMPAGAVAFGGNSYYVYDTKMSWPAAKKYCALNGGHLATITSRDEQRFVQDLPKTMTDAHVFWIGLADENRSGQWSWVTGEPTQYTNWAKGHPDPMRPLWSRRVRPAVRTPRANYAALGFAPIWWVDAAGDNLFGFVCEWEGQDQVYDYHLQPGSPCIDAGDNSYPPRDVLDLDAGDWVTDPVPVDME